MDPVIGRTEIITTTSGKQLVVEHLAMFDDETERESEQEPADER